MRAKQGEYNRNASQSESSSINRTTLISLLNIAAVNFTFQAFAKFCFIFL